MGTEIAASHSALAIRYSPVAMNVRAIGIYNGRTLLHVMNAAVAKRSIIAKRNFNRDYFIKEIYLGYRQKCVSEQGSSSG